MTGLHPTADLQYSAAGELAAAATGRLAIWYRRQWYRRAWPAQHDWTRLTLSEVEADRPRRKTGGFPFAHDGSELRSQHSAMAACRGLTDGLLHSIAQAGRLQPGVWSTRLPTTSPRALAGRLEASVGREGSKQGPSERRRRRGRRSPGSSKGHGAAHLSVSSSHHPYSHPSWARWARATLLSSPIPTLALALPTACHGVPGPAAASCACPSLLSASSRLPVVWPWLLGASSFVALVPPLDPLVSTSSSPRRFGTPGAPPACFCC